MLLIAGLGNPGTKYDLTWHNLGFRAVDLLAKRYNLAFKAGRGEFVVASGLIGKEKVVLIKPTTYMNLSGKAITQALKFYDIDQKDLIVIYDDIAISLGNVRFRDKGSAGGHNGIKSIISLLQTNEFMRIRIGFRHDHLSTVLSNNPQALPDLVLGQIPKGLANDAEDGINSAIDCLEFFLENDLSTTMNRYNKKEDN